jgi:glyoxylase-like metal-dependent hydrolase (beta-lactamase superfamily II)
MTETPEPTLYETAMARGSVASAAPKLRASAAVVLWRRAADGGLRVFWMRRDPAMKFMGGWHAFPGGTVSRADAEAEADGLPAWITGSPAGLAAADGAGGIVTATFRELFEETAVLPVRGPLASPLPSQVPRERLEAARQALLVGETPFGDLVRQLGVSLDAPRLVFAGRWLTPPFAPVRFDNRYFLLEHPTGAPEPAVPDEASEAEWVRPGDALARWRTGDAIAAPPILHILRVLAENGPEAGLERLRHPAEVDLGPFRRIEFRPGITLLPLATPTLPPATHTNAYLVAPPEGGEAVLVDPGTPFPEEAERLEAAVRAAGEAGLRLTAIWLTHHHPDHVGAVARIAQAFGVPVAAHRETAGRLHARPGSPIRVERLLEDGERIVLAGAGGGPGLSMRVLHTPGHARGHLCFLEEGLGSLLAGDMVSAVSTIVIDPPEGDMDDYLASLARLAELDPRTLFPGHGPALLGGREKLLELIEHRRWREERVLEAWRSGLRRPSEMLATVYEDAPRAAWPLAERQVEAHLRRLARSGAIDDPGRSAS